VPEPHDGHDRRQHLRVRLDGRALLVADPRTGLVVAKGQLVDLSEGGCQVRIRCHVRMHVAARVRLNLGGNVLWLPVITRWEHHDSTGWTLGCAFDRLTPGKQAALRRILFELSLTRADTAEGSAAG